MTVQTEPARVHKEAAGEIQQLHSRLTSMKDAIDGTTKSGMRGVMTTKATFEERVRWSWECGK